MGCLQFFLRWEGLGGWKMSLKVPSEFTLPSSASCLGEHLTPKSEMLALYRCSVSPRRVAALSGETHACIQMFRFFLSE